MQWKNKYSFFCCSLLTYLLTCIIHSSWRHFKWYFAMRQGINKPLNSLLCPEAFHTAKVCLACRRAHALSLLSHHTLSAVAWDSVGLHAACHWAYNANGKRKGWEQVEPKDRVGGQQMSWIESDRTQTSLDCGIARRARAMAHIVVSRNWSVWNKCPPSGLCHTFFY